MSLQFRDIQDASRRIAGHVLETPCPQAIPLSEVTGMEIFCKLEYLQRTGSFKERGARNALMQLSPEEKRRGVIAASAGNHALGLACHAQLLKIPATVVMPRFSPLTKITNCRRFGATVILEGATLAEARAKTDHIRGQNGMAYINGYDDPAIIAGQGTIGLEISRQIPDADAVIVPIGGAGLIAGVALALKSLRPGIQVIGVEPERAAGFTAAMKLGKPAECEIKPTLADGLAVSKVGANAFALARGLVDRTILVSEHDLSVAVLRLMELEKAVVEGAGAAGLAACLGGKLPDLKGRKVVLLLSGGNIDLTMLGRVLDRGLAFDGRLCRFTALISDRPGGLARLAGLIAEEGGNIVDIAHDRAFGSEDVNTVAVHCVVETRDPEHVTFLWSRLNREGFQLAARTE